MHLPSTLALPGKDVPEFDGGDFPEALYDTIKVTGAVVGGTLLPILAHLDGMSPEAMIFLIGAGGFGGYYAAALAFWIVVSIVDASVNAQRAVTRRNRRKNGEIFDVPREMREIIASTATDDGFTEDEVIAAMRSKALELCELINGLWQDYTAIVVLCDQPQTKADKAAGRRVIIEKIREIFADWHEIEEERKNQLVTDATARNAGHLAVLQSASLEAPTD